MGLLDEKQIAGIRKHKYVSEGKSILETLLIPLWNYIAARIIPKRCSQHALTLIGLLSAIIPCSILLYFCYHGDTKNIEFTSYVCAVGFLIWLHADNLDGTLARLRKTPSQFGEILDHGGDAIGVMIASLAIACMLGVNHSSFGMLMWCLSDFVVNYISEPYMTYLKGKMHFESIDFAEIMIIYASISFITAFYGLDMWSRVIIQAINFQPRYIIFACKIFIPISLVFGKTPTLLQAATEKKMSLIDALLPSVSPIIAVISALMAHTFASEAFMQRHLILFILPFGFTIVKLHYQLLVLHMTNMNNATIDHCVLFPMAMAFGMFYCSTVEAETLVMILVLITTILDTSIYMCRLHYQMYHAFNERIFILDN